MLKPHCRFTIILYLPSVKINIGCLIFSFIIQPDPWLACPVEICAADTARCSTGELAEAIFFLFLSPLPIKPIKLYTTLYPVNPACPVKYEVHLTGV
jgi:hypothetical protein